MKPAFSVLFFTVCSGAGYGLIMWMLIFHLIGPSPRLWDRFVIGGVIALGLVTLGLLSSTLHLANPKNAWRSFSRFRTSWLSREGVFAVLFYPVILMYAVTVWRDQTQISDLSMLLAVVTLLLALTVVICTGMIYASLKPIRQWHTPLTTPLYVAFSLLSGGLLFLILDLFFNQHLSSVLLACFATILLIAFVLKLSYFKLIGKPAGATINTATGFSQAQVRLLDAGHNADTFLTKEFMFDPDAKRLLSLRRYMLLLVFILPSLLLASAYYNNLEFIAYLAFLSMYVGLLIERWLFFAEARHVVRLYHGDKAT